MTAGSSSLLRPDERRLLASTLAEWGASPPVVEDTLRYAVFGPGVAGVEAQPGKPDHDVAIMVDDERDVELARLFELRRRLDDESFVAEWGIDSPAHIRVLACPTAPEALCAYSVEIARPVVVRRTFLLLVGKQARFLSWLQMPGTGVWLVPKDVGLNAWAREGLSTSDELYANSLPLGVVEAPSVGLRLALQHVGFNAPE
jgi:hypothetical protein